MTSVPSMRAGSGLACASLMFLALYSGGEGGAGSSAKDIDSAGLKGRIRQQTGAVRRTAVGPDQSTPRHQVLQAQRDLRLDQHRRQPVRLHVAVGLIGDTGGRHRDQRDDADGDHIAGRWCRTRGPAALALQGEVAAAQRVPLHGRRLHRRAVHRGRQALVRPDRASTGARLGRPPAGRQVAVVGGALAHQLQHEQR